jgi:hypothetical protein
MLLDASKIPEGVPPLVYHAATEIEANLVDPAEKAHASAPSLPPNGL